MNEIGRWLVGLVPSRVGPDGQTDGHRDLLQSGVALVASLVLGAALVTLVAWPRTTPPLAPLAPEPFLTALFERLGETPADARCSGRNAERNCHWTGPTLSASADADAQTGRITYLRLSTGMDPDELERAIAAAALLSEGDPATWIEAYRWAARDLAWWEEWLAPSRDGVPGAIVYVGDRLGPNFTIRSRQTWASPFGERT